MAETTNYGLYVTEELDDPTFKMWREKMADANDSNMVKIDQAIASLDTKIDGSVSAILRRW